MSLEQLLALLAFLGGLGLACWRAGTEFQRLRHTVETLVLQVDAHQQAHQADVDELRADLIELDGGLEQRVAELLQRWRPAADRGGPADRFGRTG